MANVLGNIPGITQAQASPTVPGVTPANLNKVVGTPNVALPTNWHTVVLWFLGAVALLALADPAPGIATALLIVIIIGVLLQNWDVYKTFLGLK